MHGKNPVSKIQEENKKQLPLITAIFFLSIFAGVLLSIIIQQWLFSHIDIVNAIQTKEEELLLEKTLDQYSY